MATWGTPTFLAEKGEEDSVSVDEFNGMTDADEQLWDCIQLLGGNGTSQPVSDITKLAGTFGPGVISMGAFLSTPTGWLLCDGSAVSRSTYADLYDVITLSKGSVTISNASPAVVTLASGDFVEGQCIELTTDGGLPTGLSVNTNYYVHRTGAGTANLSSTRILLDAGTYINTSSAGSGTHTLRYCPFGISTSANFLLPDFQSRSPKGVGTATIRGNAKTAPAFGGDEEDRLQGHYHAFYASAGGGGSTSLIGAGAQTSTQSNPGGYTKTIEGPITDGTNGTPRTGLTTRDNTIGMNFYIKYA